MKMFDHNDFFFADKCYKKGIYCYICKINPICRWLKLADKDEESIFDKIKTEIKALSNSNPSHWRGGDMVDRDDVLEIIDKYKKENEEEKMKNDMANEQISKIKKKYFVEDEYGYTDKKLVDKVNEIIDKVNELNAQMQHKADIIPHKATNGEMIEAMFPSTKIRWISQSHIGVTFRDNQDYITEFELDWWNAPFDEGVEK